MDTSLWVSIIGSGLSALGLYATYVVYNETRSIKESFFLRARLPEAIKDLMAIDRKILNDITEWSNNKEQIKVQFVKSKQLAGSLIPKVKGNDACIKEIDKYMGMLDEAGINSVHHTKDNAWKLYIELAGLIVILEQLQKDSEWD